MTATPAAANAGWWRHIPNAISAARLAATPVLLYLAVMRSRESFAWLLLACLLSDILDGLIARAFRLRSALGAVLDSVADMAVVALSLIGLFIFQMEFLRANALPLSAPIALYGLDVACALWRYGRISSFHTVLVRISAYLQGTFIMWLFFWGPASWLLYVMIGVTCVAYLEEMALMALMPDWTTDVRGIYWVLRKREPKAAAAE